MTVQTEYRQELKNNRKIIVLHKTNGFQKSKDLLKKKQLWKYMMILIVLLSSNCLTSCRSSEAPVSKTGIYFDTVITITLYGDDSRFLDGCFELCATYEQLFDRNREDSDIERINANSHQGQETKVDKETIGLLEAAKYYAALTEGRFDITVGELTSLWDYTKKTVPDADLIRQCVEQIGYTRLWIKDDRVQLQNTAASLDVGGIAKGYIADKLKEYLLNAGVKRGMINLGGNILLLGDKPDHTEYHIGIQKPFATDGTTIAVISVAGHAIVTSGVYERYFYEEDTLYHHILDTTTGYPVDNGLLSVTILSENATEADALSTGVFAMGLTEGKALIEHLKAVEAVFVCEDGQVVLTSGLKKTGKEIQISK